MKVLYRLFSSVANVAKPCTKIHSEKNSTLIEVEKHMKERLKQVKIKFRYELSHTPTIDKQELKEALERAEKNYISSSY